MREPTKLRFSLVWQFTYENWQKGIPKEIAPYIDVLYYGHDLFGARLRTAYGIQQVKVNDYIVLRRLRPQVGVYDKTYFEHFYEVTDGKEHT